MTERKKIKYSEYYTLFSAALLLRAALFVLVNALPDRLNELDRIDENFRFLFFTITEPAVFAENFIYYFYDLGMADFLLLELLTIIIICRHYSGKIRAWKILTTSGTVLFITLLTHFLLIFIYAQSTKEIMYVVRIAEPLIIYVIPSSVILTHIFVINYKKIGMFLKSSLINPKGIVFIIIIFMLAGAYVIAVDAWQKSMFELLSASRLPEDFEEKLDMLKELKVIIDNANYMVNSLFACFSVIVFYRGAKLLETKEIV